MSRAIEVLELMISDEFKYPLNDLVCSSVISGFCKIGKPESALEFYKNVGKIESLGCRGGNVVMYTWLVNALCKEGRVDEVSELVYKMEKEGVVLDAVFYSSWICGYFKEGILNEAFRKHVMMIENGVNPDTVSYTILIDGFTKEGNVEKAIGFLNEMKKDGLEPNLVTYTAIMRGFCKRGKLDEAWRVFERVVELGIEVDEMTYSTLIDGLCRRGDFDRVFGLLDEMEQKGINVGVITYNTVINGLCKVGRTSEGEVISKSTKGDCFTFSTLLHGYIQENNLVGVLETKRRLEEASVSMDVVMCNVLMKALFLLGALEDAYLIYKGMPERGLVANSVTYCALIDGYCKAGRIDEALEIFDAYRSSSSDISDDSYNCIILGLCANCMVDMAIEVFAELINKGVCPDQATYRTLIKSIYKEKNGEGVLEFLQRIGDMETDTYNSVCNEAIHFLIKKGSSEAAFGVYLISRKIGSSVASKSYYLILKSFFADQNRMLVPLMLNAFLKEYGISEPRIIKIVVRHLSGKDVKKCLHFLDRMKKKHTCITIPTTVFEDLKKQGRVLDAHKLINEVDGTQTVCDLFGYSIVVDGLCKEGFLNKALDLCVTMRKHGIPPNIVIYNSVINGLCNQGCFVQALRIFDSLEKIDLVPTVITFNTLITALSKEGYLQDAKKLLEKMIFQEFIPNTRVYNSLIDGYCKYGLLDEALELLSHFEKSFCKPDAFTIRALIDGCCRKGEMEVAREFYFKFKEKGIFPDLLGFIYLIKGLVVKGRIKEASEALEDMLQIQSIIELIDRTGGVGEWVSSSCGVACNSIYEGLPPIPTREYTDAEIAACGRVWLSGYCLQQEHSLPIPKLEAHAEVIWNPAEIMIVYIRMILAQKKIVLVKITEDWLMQDSCAAAPQPQIEASPNSSSGRSHVLPVAALWKKTRSKLNQIAIQSQVGVTVPPMENQVFRGSVMGIKMRTDNTPGVDRLCCRRMVVAQKLKEAEITEQDSLLLTRNLLRIAIFNISYIRGLFPENYFNDKSVPALEMKIKKLMPMDAESRRLIDWMEKGVYDALQKKYLKTLLFCISEAIDGPMIEEYAFSFSYSNSDSKEVMMNISRTGNKKQGATFKSNGNTDITPNQMRNSACKMVRTLVQLMRTLDRMPEERTILMKLLYYEDVTNPISDQCPTEMPSETEFLFIFVRLLYVLSSHPESVPRGLGCMNKSICTPIDYEPPFFRGCSEQEANYPWLKNPLKMEIGNVNSKHFVLALKVKSILDPCQDENNDMEDDEEISLGVDSTPTTDPSDSDSEMSHSANDVDGYIVAPVDKAQSRENNGMSDHEDDTQDAEEDEHQFTRVRDWISSYHIDNVELTDVLSSFPDISVALTEGEQRT
ncbi:hypothetical protein C5167_000661 [Papaver somniferum]|uniref:HORMA domain-containing protein n=1 Tax=Papaver somniferum TaxID=3469 RepID=A0A4Y7KUT2_PAPSO|nr:hypothetical protein C5167_000661 [Papaver somniferum]